MYVSEKFEIPREQDLETFLGGLLRRGMSVCRRVCPPGFCDFIIFKVMFLLKSAFSVSLMGYFFFRQKKMDVGFEKFHIF